MMGLAASPRHEVEPTRSTRDGATECGADASSLAIEKHRPARIVVGERDRGVVRRDLVQPDAPDVLITGQARAVRLRRRLHGLMMASAQTYRNRPQILAEPTRNGSFSWARFLRQFRPIVRPEPPARP